MLCYALGLIKEKLSFQNEKTFMSGPINIDFEYCPDSIFRHLIKKIMLPQHVSRVKILDVVFKTKIE